VDLTEKDILQIVLEKYKNMTTEQFTYWLQGFMEVANPTTLDEIQTQIIKDHLDLVFDKQTPDRTFTPQLEPIPTTPHPPYPLWVDPNPFKVTCETSTHKNNVENPTTQDFFNLEEIYNSHGVPSHLFGNKEEDKVDTNPSKVIKESKKKFRGGLKC
jgi:hypothetical protein